MRACVHVGVGHETEPTISWVQQRQQLTAAASARNRELSFLYGGIASDARSPARSNTRVHVISRRAAGRTACRSHIMLAVLGFMFARTAVRSSVSPLRAGLLFRASCVRYRAHIGRDRAREREKRGSSSCMMGEWGEGETPH